jgi:hypothetical protein
MVFAPSIAIVAFKIPDYTVGQPESRQGDSHRSTLSWFLCPLLSVHYSSADPAEAGSARRLRLDASFPAVAGLEVELVNIVVREPERIPQHDHVVQRERTSSRNEV